MVKCKECGKDFDQITWAHVHYKHNMSMEEYKQKHPNSPLKKTKKRTCEYCGQVFKSKVGLGIHIGKKHTNKLLKECPVCGKEFKVRPSNEQNFCSESCAKKGKNNPMYGKEGPWKGKSGKEHPRYKKRVSLKCKNCGKTFYVKPCLKDRKFCSHSCFMEWRHENVPYPRPSEERLKRMSERMKRNNPTSDPEVRKKISEALKGKHNSPETEFGNPKIMRKALKGQRERPTKLEQKTIHIIEEGNLPFKYVGDGSVLIHGKNPDFIATDGSKKIIETFGNYWHEPEEEGERIDFFSEFGYDTLVLWEDEIEEKSEKDIIEKIRRFR